jgi:pimeloyl-ACP methyl ester carboxylesterase
MPLASTPSGNLYYEIVDHVAPWVPDGEAGRETIVFHHGIGGSLGLWAGWIPQLVDRYRLVMFDMRGCGRSHIPDEDFAWSLDQMARDVFAVADAAGVERFHLVGESIGGTAALAAILAQPARIATLTVSNGAHVGTTLGGVQAWCSTIDERGIKHWSDIFMHDRFHDGALSAAQWAWFAAQQQAWSRASILNALGVLVGTDLSARLGGIRCPTLLLHPDGSPFIAVPIMAELHRLLPDARLRVVEHSRHGLPFSHAGICSAALRSFLDSDGAG